VILMIPEGTVSETGRRFWNATSGCCDFHDSGVDDLAYITGLIETAQRQLNANPDRVYVAGLSNGGFMAERLACDAAGLVTGVLNISGSGPVEPDRCTPSRPVAYLRLHSDADDVIPYEGNARMPSAATCIARWRETNSCAGEVSEERLDLDGHNHGAESIHQRSEGCDATAGVHLMTMVGSGHVPQLTPSAQRLLLKLLMTYRR
jgi:polyhydroxybutyrate depolymerase